MISKPSLILAAMWLATGDVGAAAPVEMRAAHRVFRMDPATLRLESVSSAGNALLLSEGQQRLGTPSPPRVTGHRATWELPASGLSVDFTVTGEGCTVRLTASRTGSVTWPVVAPDRFVKGLILPRAEGNWVPPENEEWARILDFDNTLTEEFSLPCWELDLGPQTVTYLVPEPFGARIVYARKDGRIGFAVTRRFTRLETERTWEVQLAFGAGSPVEPARRYRAWMQARGRFVAMTDKIAAPPRPRGFPAPSTPTSGDCPCRGKTSRTGRDSCAGWANCPRRLPTRRRAASGPGCRPLGRRPSATCSSRSGRTTIQNRK